MMRTIKFRGKRLDNEKWAFSTSVIRNSEAGAYILDNLDKFITLNNIQNDRKLDDDPLDDDL